MSSVSSLSGSYIYAYTIPAQVRYPIGFERMVRAAVKNLEKLNLKVTMRAYSSAANKQYDYDHKSDRAFYLDKAFVEYDNDTNIV